MSKFVIQSEIERETLDWGTLAWLSNPPATGSSHLTVIDVELAVGGGHNFHRHPAQEEVLVVLSGTVEQWLDKEKRVLRPGDALYIDANVVHASFNAGNDKAKLLAILGPCKGEIGYEMEDMAGETPWRDLRSSS